MVIMFIMDYHSLSFIPIRYRHSPVLSKGPGGYLDPRRGLSPFIFTPVHHRDDPRNGLLSIPHGRNLFNRPVLFYIGVEDRVQYLVWREGGCVFLPRPQFCCRLFNKDPFRDRRPPLLPPRHIPIKRGIPYTHLALVPCGQHKPAKLI